MKKLNKTADIILDTAEKLFAEHGYASVSTRTITEESGVNRAALHYHFGSKDALMRAIFDRRLGSINQEREARLSQILDNAAQPVVEDVLTSFIGPTLNVGSSDGEQNFKLLAARSSIDPSLETRQMVFEFYDRVGRLFIKALERALPELSREELFWRAAFVYGAMLYVRADNGRLQHIMGEDLSMSDNVRAMKEIVPFLAAGLRAPR